MRLPVESFAGRARGLVLTLVLVPLLAACGSHRELASVGAGLVPANGPAADYPVVIGAPYKIGDNVMASLFEPDGPSAPAYLLTQNYRVILEYNCSNYYAMSVGLLADEIAR